MDKTSIKILIRVPNWIGDAVISTGFIEICKNARPEALISVLAHQRVASLFENNPNVQDIIAFNGDEGILRITKSIKSRHFDRAYILPMSFSSALICFLAGIKERIGYASELRGSMLSKGLKYSQAAFRSKHILNGFAQILNDNFAPMPPRIYLTDDEKGKAVKRLSDLKTAADGLVGFGPGATYGLAKMWPADNWILLGRRLAENGKKIIIFGSATEHDLCQNIAIGTGYGTVNLAGKLNLRESAALLNLIPTFITNDTGVMHLAAASGSKVTAIFGSTNPAWTGPWGEGHHIIYTKEPCSPCYKRTCRFGHYNCLKNVSSDDIIRVLAIT
jgi:heptosyltransferase-2